MAEYMRRFVTGDYEYAEVRSDDFADFVEACANVADMVPQEQATATVKKTFGNTTTVKPAGGFGSKGRQSQQSLPDKVELGEHEGYTITLHTKGKFGPYVNAYNGQTKERMNVNVPKRMDPSQVDLNAAIEILSDAA